MSSDEELRRALELEEKALNEFKRRKNSCPQSHTKSNINGKLNILINKFHEKVTNYRLFFADSKFNYSLHSSSSSSNISRTTVDELDLISFTGEIQDVSLSDGKKTDDDPYNKIKESILKLHDKRNSPTVNQQLVPYNNQIQLQQQQQQQLSLQSLYNLSATSSINQYYSQQMYFHTTPYPKIGFENFVQQTTYSNNNNNHNNNYGFQQQQQQIPFAFHQQQQQQTAGMWNKPSSSILPMPSTSSSPQVLRSNSRVSEISNTNMTMKTSKSNTSLNSSSSSNAIYSTQTDNLINLDDGDDGDLFSNILQAFDPLITKNDEASNSYYTDQDPFDYIYSGGTQYSDPLYEAVIRSDASAKNQSIQDVSEYYATSQLKDENYALSSMEEPPPLPPRNSSRPNQSDSTENQQIYTNQYSKKLYENIVECRKFDKDSMAFYRMVKELRSKYLYDDESSNIGHIVAAQLDSKYINVSSIKILVYPSCECFTESNIYQQSVRNKSLENYQKLENYLAPIIFTCDIKSSVMHVIMQVLTMLENDMSGSAEKYALKTIGSQEWLSHDSCLSHLEYIHNQIKLEKDVLLGLFPRTNEYMKVIARTHQDDLRDAELKIENIVPTNTNTSISYESLIILLETLETEIDKLESASTTHIYSTFNASGVIQAVKAICALLGAIDTFELHKAINNLKDTCDEQLRNLQVSFI